MRSTRAIVPIKLRNHFGKVRAAVSLVAFDAKQHHRTAELFLPPVDQPLAFVHVRQLGIINCDNTTFGVA